MNDKKTVNVCKPLIHESVFVAEGARIYGDVQIGENSSVWFNAVIRAENGKIRIGRKTNIQDNVVIHNQPTKDVEIGDHVTVGHGAILRCCKIGNHVMIGMNATIMSGAEIGDYSIVGSNSLITYNKKFQPGSLITGSPARRVGEVAPDAIRESQWVEEDYREIAALYANDKIQGHRKRS